MTEQSAGTGVSAMEDRWDLDERHRKRLGLAGGLLGLLVLLACVWWVYPRLKGLLEPEVQVEGRQAQGTNDVPVTRGPLTQALLVSGVVEPERTAKLSFAAASGQVAMVYVQPGMVVAEGELLLELDRPALQRELAKVRGELLEARNALDKLLDDRGLLKRIALEEDLRKARLNLEEVRRELELFQRGKGTPEDMRARAAGDLATARDSLADLRDGQRHGDALEAQRITADLAEIEHGPYAWIQNPSEEDRDRTWLLRITMLNSRDAYNQALLQHDMAVRAAEQAVVLAQRALRRIDEEIAAGSTVVELKKRQAAVQGAEARVQQLQYQLQAMDEGAPDPDVAKAQSLVVKLEGRVADAEASLQEATLTAPFAAIVAEVRTAPGALATPGMELIQVYSASQLRVMASVNEMDIGQLAQGQEAQLTFDAFPGDRITGTLAEIPRYGTYQYGLTFFKVPLTFDPGDLGLRTGMSANVSVPLARKDDVLVVPTMAVQRDAEGRFVLVVTNGKTARRSVETGISDGIQTEVVSGLVEGETVRVPLVYPIGPVYR